MSRCPAVSDTEPPEISAKKREPADKPGSVAGYRPRRRAPPTAIPLVRESPPGSSGPGACTPNALLPPTRKLDRAGLQRRGCPRHPACLFGVAPDGGCRVSPPGFTLGLVSVALFVVSPRRVVIPHPALWSPDFPLPRIDCRRVQRLPGRLPRVFYALAPWQGPSVGQIRTACSRGLTYSRGTNFGHGASMEKNAALGKVCSDCEGLRSGMRSSRDPHQYLVLTNRSSNDSSRESYRCLVCASNLTLVRNGNSNFWT